jgi:hypothetical protein
MTMPRFQTPGPAILAAAIFCLAFLPQAARASITLNATVGGSPTGGNYTNFDNLVLGNAGGTSSGIGVSFSGDGQVVQGAASGIYAAPYLSNSNGILFGDATVSGVDSTHYLSSGVGAVTLTLPSPQTYLGLLWGSVDLYNTLSFYSGATLVGQITGANVNALANGDQGINGTYYVNITSDTSFDRVVASSSQYAFEFDNVALQAVHMPEPASLTLFAIAGLAGLVSARRRKRVAA